MMTLITGFNCPPTTYFKFITNCDKCYYKVRQVLQNVTILLQSATGITKCDDYYKVRQYTVVFFSQLGFLIVSFSVTLAEETPIFVPLTLRGGVGRYRNVEYLWMETRERGKWPQVKR